MKKCLFVLLFIVFVSSMAHGQVNVYFLPESGYLRVQGEINIKPSSPNLAFIVFPNAQITEFWAKDLGTYQIDRSGQATVVNFGLKTLQPQTLSFAYEGFLAPQGQLVTFDRDSLWFPEFSFAMDDPEILLQIPTGWSWLVPTELATWQQGASQMVSWQGRSKAYPSFYLTNDPSLLTKDLGMPGEEKAFPENLILTEEYLSKLQMQVARLTNAMNARNDAELTLLMQSELQQKGLAKYLASLPLNYGKIRSEFLSHPLYLEDSFRVLFTTDTGLRFQATMTWEELHGRIQLGTFALTPAGFAAPEHLSQALEDFVSRLKEAVETEDRAKLRSFLNTNLDPEMTVEFLASLRTENPWTLQYVALEPFRITILVPHSAATKLLLNLELSPGEEDWLINSLDVIPLG